MCTVYCLMCTVYCLTCSVECFVRCSLQFWPLGGSKIRASILPSVAAVVSGYLEYGVQCALCRVQVTLYCVICSVWCTAFSLKLAACSMIDLVCSMQCAVFNVRLHYNLKYSLCIMQYLVRSVQQSIKCAVCSIQCAVCQIVQRVMALARLPRIEKCPPGPCCSQANLV